MFAWWPSITNVDAMSLIIDAFEYAQNEYSLRFKMSVLGLPSKVVCPNTFILQIFWDKIKLQGVGHSFWDGGSIYIHCIFVASSNSNVNLLI